ncbi:hypothetical protein EK21DRAFT_111653 [Setomelanomma holmii]|uniref:Monooxygenase n=1 Tax=Setomelanomma holmii TaxID=210430 RepID=A0A9P4LNK5_9PLEO|nr:hypothetical protein EK21DRAFT_111653 [Setomelanomma holmii]
MSGILSIFEASDYTISTWLILGATIQSLLVASLPLNVALLPPITLLLFRFIRGYLIANNILPNSVAKEVILGRQTWQIPSEDNTVVAKPSSDSIVVLVLTASWTHPNGRFSPGSQKVGEYFIDMWKDAAENREKYGFLGNTPGLTTADDGVRQDTKGTTTVYLSYWKTLEGLHKFAHGNVHMQCQMWWDRTAMKEFPHIGVGHEVYEVPAGNWENVYHNFRPFGISNAEYPVSSKGNEATEGEEGKTQWVNGLRDANGKNWKTMYSRMGRKAAFGVVKTA